MNDLETNFERRSLESFPPEPQKLTAYQQKLRQLIKKSPNPLQSTSPTHFSHQLSKHTAEGTLWETCSPTVSRLSDCSNLIGIKPKPDSNSKSNVAVSSKFGSKVAVTPPVEDSKSKSSIFKTKSKIVSPSVSLGFASPTNAANLNMNGTATAHAGSAKENSFNPQSHINFLMFQPKTSQYQGKKPIKLNSYFHDEEEDDKNLSLDNKTKSFMTPLYQQKRDLNSKNASREITTSPQKENKGHSVINKENVENAKTLKSKGKSNQFSGEIKKSDSNSKKKPASKVGNTVETPTNKVGSTGNLGIKKRNLQVDNETANEVSRDRRDTLEKVLAKQQRHAVTPENLTSREVEPLALEDSGDLSLKQSNLLVDRKASVPLAKEIRLDSRKRQRSTKGTRPKTGSKGVSKQESPCKNPLEAVGNRRKENQLLRAAKMSSPNVLSSTISQTGCSSTKNNKKGDSQLFMHGDVEKSNEMTLSGIQDTTANTKGASKKDLTFEENEKKTVKAKRLMRAKSHGGNTQIEETIAEMGKTEKGTVGKGGVKGKSKLLHLKQKVKDKRLQGSFKSVDYKNVQKDIDNRGSNAEKSPSKQIQAIEEKEESMVLKLEPQEKIENINQEAMLCQMLERTTKLLCGYREREKNWQIEKKELLEKLNMLKEKENLE